MSNNITITVHEDGDCTHILRNLGSVDPFGSLVDAFCDAVKAAGYGTDSRFVALGYYWEALDEAADEFVESVWDGVYQVGDRVWAITSVDGMTSIVGREGTVVDDDEELLLVEFDDWKEGHGTDNSRWYVTPPDVKFISRPTTT